MVVTIEDIILLSCIVVVFFALCVIVIILRKMSQIKGTKNHEDSASSESSGRSVCTDVSEQTSSESSGRSVCTDVSEQSGGNCASLRSVLMSSLWCCEAKKWQEKCISSWKENLSPLLGLKGREGDVGWQSHSSDSPVWQRPILMGEKCEFPRFSGLILYDERGHPLHESHKETSHTEVIYKEKTAAAVRTTLRDLL